MFLPKTIVLASFAVFTMALSQSNVGHNALHHRALAARVVSPSPALDPIAPESHAIKSLRRRSRACNYNAASSSSVVQPATSAQAAPTSTKKTTMKAASPTTSQHENSPSPTSNLPVYLQGTNTGDATEYPIGMGACGIFSSGDAMIVAVSEPLFNSYPGYNGENPNDNPICNRQITAHYQGSTVQVTVTDYCQNCALEDLDFSPAAFLQLTGLTDTRVHGMTWTFD